MTPDIRWLQRFSNYRRACELLSEAASLKSMTNLEIEGMIQRFEYTFELAWKTMKDYLEDKGFTEIVGSRDAIRLAFSNGIITDGEVWMEMLADRNLTTQLYDEDKANRIANDIIQRYLPCYVHLRDYLEQRLP